MLSDAAVKDAQNKSSLEECAAGMGQRSCASDATVMDAKINLKGEECALGMGQIQLSLPPQRQEVEIVASNISKYNNSSINNLTIA